MTSFFELLLFPIIAGLQWLISLFPSPDILVYNQIISGAYDFKNYTSQAAFIFDINSFFSSIQILFGVASTLFTYKIIKWIVDKISLNFL